MSFEHRSTLVTKGMQVETALRSHSPTSGAAALSVIGPWLMHEWRNNVVQVQGKEMRQFPTKLCLSFALKVLFLGGYPNNILAKCTKPFIMASFLV